MKSFLSAALLLSLVSFNLGIEPKIQLRCWAGDFACLTALNQANQPALTASVQRFLNEKFYTMFIDNLHVDQGGLQFDMNNVIVRGLKDAVIDHLSIDPLSKTLRLVYHSDLYFKSKYTTNGFLFGLPMFGDGDIKIDMHNVVTEMAIPYQIIKDISGQDVVDLKEYKYWFDVKAGPTYRLDNLYRGDEKSSQIMHNLLHQNWKDVTNVYGRYLFDKVNDNIFNAIRSYMHSQPIKALY